MNNIGGCHCGSLRYKIIGEPMTCYTCHCTDCQKATGSAFTISVILEEKNLTITNGVAKTDSYQLNDNQLHRYSCENCGHTVWLTSPEHPGFLALRGGTMDDKKSIKPIAHIWFRSALPWVQVSPEQKNYEQQPTMRELIELWNQRGAET